MILVSKMVSTLTLLIAVISSFFWHHSQGVIVEDTSKVNVSFRIGKFIMSNSIDDGFILTLLRHCREVGGHPHFKPADVFLIFKSVQGWSLEQVSRHHKDREAVFLPISHELNRCSGKLQLNEEKEALFHVALGVWPLNTYVVKNLLFYYEWHGYYAALNEVYRDSISLTRNEGLMFQQIFAAPPILFSTIQAENIHFKILQYSYAFLNTVIHSTINPQREIREFQQNILYIGHATGITVELYSLCMSHYLKPFQQSIQDKLVVPNAALPRKRDHLPFRIGIVSEHSNNGAPELCIAEVFKKLSPNCDSSLGVLCVPLELIFFDRPNLNNELAEVLRNKSAQTIVLNQQDFSQSAAMILSQNLDMLFYIALPTEKFTILLSQLRLAPVQAVFGAGHPVTSGSSKIDYNIMSYSFIHHESMLTQAISATDINNIHSTPRNSSDDLYEDSVAYACARAASAHVNYQEYRVRFPQCSSIGGTSNGFYTEQPILMDSIGYFLQDSTLFYPELNLSEFLPPNSARISCLHIDNLLELWNIAPNVSTTTFSIPCVRNNITNHHPANNKRLYSCIQLNRKMHPLFDMALKRIIEIDKNAVIAVSHKAEVLVERWEQTLGLTRSEIYAHFVFVPKLVHPDFLKFLSFSAVVLNTFPFGAGITSSEALSMCVPVLVLPNLVSTAQLALSQVRALKQLKGENTSSNPLETLLTADTINDFATRAMQIASLTNIQSWTTLWSTTREFSNFYDNLNQVLNLRPEEKSVNIHFALRTSLCSQKENLFSEDVLNKVTEEWRNLLSRIASQQRT